LQPSSDSPYLKRRAIAGIGTWRGLRCAGCPDVKGPFPQSVSMDGRQFARLIPAVSIALSAYSDILFSIETKTGRQAG